MHGAVICHSIHGDSLELFLGNCSCIALLSGIHATKTILSIHSIHGDSLELFQTILSIHSIHGDKKYFSPGSLVRLADS